MLLKKNITLNTSALAKKVDDKLSSFNELAKIIYKYGGVFIIVGGAIRNVALNQSTTDYDAEVYFIETERLQEILLSYGYSTALVGISFGVIKVPKYNLDIVLPRKEICFGVTHRSFKIQINPYSNYISSATRRDFTINSIGYCPLYKIFLDPFSGLQHMQQKIIKATSNKTFIEDPLRILRLLYFHAKTGFNIDIKLWKSVMQHKKKIEHISNERISCEFKKMFSQKNIHFLFYLISSIESPKFKFIEEIYNKKIYKRILILLLKQENFYSKIIIMRSIISNNTESFFNILRFTPNITITQIKQIEYISKIFTILIRPEKIQDKIKNIFKIFQEIKQYSMVCIVIETIEKYIIEIYKNKKEKQIIIKKAFELFCELLSCMKLFVLFFEENNLEKKYSINQSYKLAKTNICKFIDIFGKMPKELEIKKCFSEALC